MTDEPTLEDAIYWRVTTHPERVMSADDRLVLEIDGPTLTIWHEEYGDKIDKVTIKWGEL